MITILGYECANAQVITNVDFGVSDNTIKITYDLVNCPANENYDIKLFISEGGKLSQLQQGVSGDLKQVSCGRHKTILWEVLADRNDLKGNIHFEVRIGDKHKIKVKKTSSFKEWKLDKGYAGGSIGGFVPYGTYATPSDNLEQNGAFFNGSFGYLVKDLIGICGSIYWYLTPISEDLEIASWSNGGIMVGPLISIPLGNKVKWDLRPQFGYSLSSVFSTSSFLPGTYDEITSGMAYNIGTGLRLNLGQNASYLLSFEYFSTKPKFDGYPIEPNIATLGLSVGVAYRLY